MNKCPCNEKASYKKCCKKFHIGNAYASNPLELMRSRYSAYVLNDIKYIIKTTTPLKRDALNIQELKEWATNTKWYELEIVDFDNDKGYVEFIARYSINNKKCAHHEYSLFKKIDCRWYYDDAEFVKE